MTSQLNTTFQDFLGTYHELGEVLSRLQRQREAVLETMEYVDPFVLYEGSTQNSAAPANSTITQRAQNENVVAEVTGLENTMPQFTGPADTMWNMTGPEDMMLGSLGLNNTMWAPTQNSAPVNGAFAPQAQNEEAFPEFTGLEDMMWTSSDPADAMWESTNLENTLGGFTGVEGSVGKSTGFKVHKDGHPPRIYGQECMNRRHRSKGARRRQPHRLESVHGLQQIAGEHCHPSSTSEGYHSQNLNYGQYYPSSNRRNQFQYRAYCHDSISSTSRGDQLFSSRPA